MQLLVTGGNGFIGRRLCRRAVADGHDVTSVARSGPPDPDDGGRWVDEVDWIAANVFEPDSYRAHLTDADTVVHSIGIISETPAEGSTFDRINGDSAILAALEAERADVDRFVYISSSTKPPFVDDDYIESRRRAERAIADLELSVAVPRFGPVYGPGQPHFPAPVNRLFGILGKIEFVARQFGDDRPFSVEQAAEATYQLATTDALPESPVRAERLAELSQ